MIRFRSTRCRYICALLTIFLLASDAAYLSADELIWTVAGTSPPRGVQRLNLETLQPSDVYVTDSDFAWSMAIDEVGGYVYWTATMGGDMKVMRKRLCGAGAPEPILSSGPGNFFSDIAIDSENQTLYWTSVNAGRRVARSDLDGSNIETVSLATSNAFGINVDSVNEKLYWLDSGTRAVVEANLDGSGQRNLASFSLEPLDIAFNPTTHELYWSEHKYEFIGQLWTFFPGEGRIMKVNVDTLEVSTVITGLDRPNTITIDAAGETLYWGDAHTDQIYRATIAGDDIESIFTFVNESSINYLSGMTDLHFREIPEPSCAFLCFAGYLGVVVAGRKR